MQTTQGIPNVHVIGSSGRIIAVSDNNGQINLDKIKNTSLTKLVLHHISYESLPISKTDLLSEKDLYLVSKTTYLKEFAVSDEEPLYFKLTGFYRVYQTKSDVPYYYTDGIINYYIPMKKNKSNVKITLDEYRSFINPELKDDFAESPGIIQVGFGETNYPYISKYLFENKEEVRKNLIFIEEDTVGSINRNTENNTLTANIDLVAPDSVKKFNLFGYQMRMLEDNITESYQDSIHFKNLRSQQVNRKLQIWHKKVLDTNFVDVFTEFYVTETSYVYDKAELKTTNFSRKTSSYYSTEYWSKWGEIPFVTTLLNNSLTEQKNRFEK